MFFQPQWSRDYEEEQRAYAQSSLLLLSPAQDLRAANTARLANSVCAFRSTESKRAERPPRSDPPGTTQQSHMSNGDEPRHWSPDEHDKRPSETAIPWWASPIQRRYRPDHS